MISAKAWHSEMVAQFIAVQLLCFVFALGLAGALQKTGWAAFQAPAGAGAVLLGTLGFQGATWVLIPIFLRQHQADWHRLFDFRRSSLKRAIVLAVLAAVLALPAMWFLQSLSVWTLTRLGWPPEEQAAVVLITGAKSAWLQAYLAFFAVVLAPVAEEFIFRGVLYPFVKELGSPRVALFGVNAVFALIHFDAGTLVPLFVLALILTWLYERTDNLLAPIVAHSLFNGANLLLLLCADPMGRWLERVIHAGHHP